MYQEIDEKNELYLYSSKVLTKITKETSTDYKQWEITKENVHILEIVSCFISYLPVGLYILSMEQLKLKNKTLSVYPIITSFMPLCVFIFDPIFDYLTNNSKTVFVPNGSNDEFSQLDKHYLLIEFVVPCVQEYQNDVSKLKKIINAIYTSSLTGVYVCKCFYELKKLNSIFKTNNIVNIINTVSDNVYNNYHECRPLFTAIKSVKCFN